LVNTVEYLILLVWVVQPDVQVALDQQSPIAKLVKTKLVTIIWCSTQTGATAVVRTDSTLTQLALGVCYAAVNA
jgi:hypothetical protein